MTFAQVWTFLRWPLAILGLLAVANYALANIGEAASDMFEFDASGSILAPDVEETEVDDLLDDLPEPEPVATLAPPAGPVTADVAVPIADFTVNRSVADTTSPALTLTDDPFDAIVVAFDIPPGDPGCMAELTLTMTTTELVGTVELGVFPSTLDDPAGLVDGQQVDGDLRASQSPMTVAFVEESGGLVLDLTAAYPSYFTQEFPEGRPLSLTLTPTVPLAEGELIRFASANSGGEAVPTLTWSGLPECPAGTDSVEEPAQ